MKRFTILLIALLCASAAHANRLLDVQNAAFTSFSTFQPSGGSVLIMPAVNNVSTNWAHAGLADLGGIPNRTTQCGSTISPSGVTPPAGGDDFAHITSAIAACTAGQFVLLASGTFVLDTSEQIVINKAVSLRGNGSCTNTGAGAEPPTPICNTLITVSKGMLQTYANNGSCNSNTLPGTNPCPGANYNIAVRLGVANTNNLWWAGCAYSVSAAGCGSALSTSAAQGDTTVTVASVTHFSVGMWVRIDENSGATSQANPANNTGGSVAANLFGASDFAAANTNPAIGRIVYCPGCTTVEDGAGYGALYDRETSEIHKITNITGNVLTFDSPLTIAFRTSHTAQVYWPTDGSGTNTPFIEQAGLENVSISRATATPITIQYCAYCWVKNVDAYLWRGGLVMSNAARIELNSIYIHDAADSTNNGQEYPIAFDGATTESLLVNSIMRFGGKGMVGRSCGGGNVAAYNYIGPTFYEASSLIGNYWLDMGLNGSHYVGCHHMLFEGNYADNCDNDETHGNEAYHTFFRNWCTSQREAFTDPSLSLSSSVTFGQANSTVNDASGLGYAVGNSYPTQPAIFRAAGAMIWDYEMAWVGNVLGISGVTTSANSYVYNGCNNSIGCANTQKGQIWLLGYSGSECGTGGVYCTDPNTNGVNTPQLFFRSGNYDYFHNSIFDWASGYSQSLPSSLYVSSQPVFFGASGTNCTYPWPWVTSQSSPFLQQPTGGSCTAAVGIPAKARWDAGTPFVQP